MMTTKHTCCAHVFSGTIIGHTCFKTAKVERDGKWYCGIHDPVAVNEKREKRDAEWQAEYNAKLAARNSAANKQAETQRRADCYDELLAALILCYDHCRLYHPEVERNNVGESVRSAITKAKGEVK